MIPNYYRKVVSGWSNYSGMVISHKIDENLMGNRGSKSDVIANKNKLKIGSVKEQRVDGSYFGYKLYPELRCILFSFERSYVFRNHSKQLIKKFSTLQPSHINKLNPWFVTGLTDAEGMFTIMIDKNNKRTLGWRVQAKYQIGLHVRDLDLLLQLQKFFCGIGSIGKSGNMAYYSVSGIEDLTNIVLPHFKKYFLLTQKAADFILFKQVVEIIKAKEHLSIEGLRQIMNIKSTINSGLSDSHKLEFSNIIPVSRPIIKTEIIPSPYWITGFVNGEGTFDVKIYNSKNKVGYGVQMRFRVPQHERDTKLIELLIDYFGYGVLEKHTIYPAVSLIIVKYSIITEKIIPFFELYPLTGQKHLDFLDWCKISKLMSEGSHLTMEGLNLIREIKDRMNKGRK